MYALCVMSQFPENVTLLLLNRCHVILEEQPTTFGVPSWLEFLGMVNGFVSIHSCKSTYVRNVVGFDVVPELLCRKVQLAPSSNYLAFLFFQIMSLGQVHISQAQ